MNKKSQGPKRRKHVPHRTCVVCRTVRPKRELVRVVRTSEGTMSLDETGKRSGRGAYVCRQRSCWDAALAKRHLERALKTELSAEVGAELEEYAKGLPQTPETESEEEESQGVSV